MYLPRTEEFYASIVDYRNRLWEKVKFYTREEAQAMLDRGEITHISKCRLAGTMTEPGSDSLCVPNLTGTF